MVQKWTFPPSQKFVQEEKGDSMYALKRKTKEGTTYYLCKSYRDVNTGKSTSKIIEKIGTEKELKKRTKGNIDKWLKDYISKYSEKKSKFQVEYNSDKKLQHRVLRRLNGGYFPIKKICNDLKLKTILKNVKNKEGYTGEFENVVYSFIIDNIILHGMQDSYRLYAESYIEQMSFKKKDIYNTIKILDKYKTYIQSELFWSAYRKLKFECSMLYNECKNYCYMFTKNGKNYFKVFQLDVFYDKHGYPVAYFNNTDKDSEEEESNTIYDVINNLDELNKVMYSSNMLPSNVINKMYEDKKEIRTLKDISIRNLPQHTQEWIINDDSWNILNDNKTYNIKKIIQNNPDLKLVNKTKNYIFYKSCKIIIGNEPKTLIALYNGNQKETDRINRYIKYTQIKRLMDKNIINNYDRNLEESNIYKKISELLKTSTESETLYDFDNDRLDKDILFDGFDAMLIDQDVEDIENVIKVKYLNNETKDAFDTIKDEFSVLPSNISIAQGSNAHILICYISLLIMKAIQQKRNNPYSIDELRQNMAYHDFTKIDSQGWIPVFVTNKVTSYLDKICNIETDYEFITDEDMKKIIQKIRK